MLKENLIYDPDDYVDALNLVPHPEGGFYKETYRADDQVTLEAFSGARNVSTGIYYLLTHGHFSAFHRIRSDEMWHFYDGSDLSVYVINPTGALSVIKLGRDIKDGQVLQAVVPAGCWFASRVEHANGFALVGCTVAPGFDFQDFELAERSVLIRQYPQHGRLITELTREKQNR